jgi:hypothetical protein
MYLTGDRYRTTSRQRGELKAERYDLGYWRKHPNLHGYIVEHFADGRDECQEIDLMPDDLLQIIDAIRGRRLPHTVGFFFGESDDSDEQIAEDIAIFEQAIRWVEAEDPDHWRGVTYQASW